MRKLAVVLGMGLVASIVMAAPAAATTSFQCNEVVTGGSFHDVTVPRDGSCTLIDSTVSGKVKVKRGAFFQATGTDIARGVYADDALTVFIDTGSTVGRSVEVDDTAQVFVFNATIGRDIEVDDASEVVQICGTTVTKGDVEVTDSGIDILVGDPQAVDCAGNTVADGDVELNHNRAEIEFVVRGNTIPSGDLEVNRNRGPAEKFVEDNTGGDELECWGNESPFTASGNTGWDEKEGQCREVLTCVDTLTGVTTDDVVVPLGGACTLIDSTVAGNVFVASGGFFQATGTDIAAGSRRTTPSPYSSTRGRPSAAASRLMARRRCSCSTRRSARSRLSTARRSSRSAARRSATTSRSSAAGSTSSSAIRSRRAVPATRSATTWRSSATMPRWS